jgi:cystathionine beta-lyase
MDLGNASAETILTHLGRHPEDHFGFVNTPVFRGSTVLFKTLADLEARSSVISMAAPAIRPRGRRSRGHRTRGAYRYASAAIRACRHHSGDSRCVKAGDEILITDNAYEPTRSFATEFLAAMGVTTRYYDPRIGGGVASLISDNTKAIFVESPGSVTFEVQDLPAIVAVASRGIRVIVDNSWATPLFHRRSNWAPTSWCMRRPRCSSGIPMRLAARFPPPTRMLAGCGACAPVAGLLHLGR